MPQPPDVLAHWMKANLFNAVPMAIGAIDRQFNLVYANQAFEKMFGPWQGKKCYQVYSTGFLSSMSLTFFLSNNFFSTGIPIYL